MQDYPTQDFGETEHAPPITNGTRNYGPGNWNQYWPVDMSAYDQGKLSFSCKGQANQSYTVAVGPLTLVGPAGTKVVDDFSYYKDERGAWGARSSWLTEWPGSPTQPWLKIQCVPNTTTTVNRPVQAAPSLAYVFQAYDYTHLRHEYLVDSDFLVSNTQGATAPGGVIGILVITY